MKLLAYIGAYCLLSKACEHERITQRRQIGAALVRIEAGIGTTDDYALINEVKRVGREALKNNR